MAPISHETQTILKESDYSCQIRETCRYRLSVQGSTLFSLIFVRIKFRVFQKVIKNRG